MILEYILPTIGIIAVLLLLSAFFSGSETALTAVSRPRMHERERQGDHRAMRVNALTDHREQLIGSILLGNNLVNIGASALATGLLVEFFGDSGIVYATLGMTLLVLIFAEVLPKTYAIHNPIRVSLAVAPIMRLIVVALAPPVRAVQFVVNGTLKLFGVRIQAGRSFTAAEEELRGAIELHQGPEKEEVEDERRMLRSILDLGDVDVDEVLTHRSELETVNADAPAAEIVKAVLSSPYTRIPAWRDEPDNIVGVIHAKALFLATQKAGGSLDKLNIAECWQAPWFIPETTNLLDQLREFRARREHFAIVVDEYGALMGVVTLEDILEEIVGEIEDEHDRSRPGAGFPGVRVESNGTYLVEGAVTIRDLNREFDWVLPDESAATIAGLVMHEARRIPETGQVFAFHGFRFEVVRRRKNRIVLLRLAALDGTAPAATESEPEPARGRKAKKAG
ncbi:MAG: HlyC/CorC family transporter [Alphaproteobacteria bacterium]|nr:HlyC/CorC family transporter [Alphaproteobacteria bacterium]